VLNGNSVNSFPFLPRQAKAFCGMPRSNSRYGRDEKNMPTGMVDSRANSIVYFICPGMGTGELVKLRLITKQYSE
jgi:hypothetical protein